MVKINFQNNITKANADTFNTMQDNIETAINNVEIELDDQVSTSSTNGVENQAITNYVDNKLTYSTDEVRVGTFMGKPLYRMAIESTSVANAYNINASNVDKIVNVGGMIRRSDYDIWQFLPSRLDNAGFSAQFGNLQIYSGYVQVQVSLGTSWSSTMSRIIIYIEYTKTTD